MSQQTILKVENISKQYRLGNVGTGTLSHDLNRWWHQIRGKENPYAKVGAVNDRSATATQDYVWAIKNINFEVKKGEVLGIIGKNGAGKSTLLKILSRVTSPTTGSIKTKGRIASLLEVGTGFHPELTGKENIYLNGAILGMNKAEINSKIDEIIEFSGCQMYIDTPVKRYSSGMRVRLAFAVAAFLEPDILVIDEVLAVGDAEFQKKAIGKMQDISKGDGRTVIFVSHNMAAVKSLCTRGFVLGDGLIEYKGNQDEIVDYYLNSNLLQDNIEIRNRVDREGSQKMKLVDVQFLNENDEVISTFFIGEYLKLRFDLENITGFQSDDLKLAVNIIDNQGNFILSFLSDEFGQKLTTDSNIIDLVIPSLMLRSGKYNLRFLLSEIAFTEKLFIDKINFVTEFVVYPKDIFKSAMPPRPGLNAIINGSFEQN